MEELNKIAQYYLDGLITGDEMYLRIIDAITDMADNENADANMREFAYRILQQIPGR